MLQEDVYVAVETKVKPAHRDVNVSTALTFLALVHATEQHAASDAVELENEENREL